jgi:hypothetical protein
MEITVTGCKDLDFEPHYSAKRQLIQGGKIFWLRKVEPDLPAMVQFCKKRGRLNDPLACTCVEKARCSEYSESESTIEISVEELEGR